MQEGFIPPHGGYEELILALYFSTGECRKA